MKLLWAIMLVPVFTAASNARPELSAKEAAEFLSQITLDRSETFRVRDLQLRRGDTSFYFTDGLLSFANAIEGKRLAAVFTTSGAEVGDAEVLLMPPQAAERQSLARYAHTPNLDEHFHSAILYFTDNTADELLSQIGRAAMPKAPGVDPELRGAAERVLRNASAQVKTRMVATILDSGAARGGFFYAALQGTAIGTFDVLYNPDAAEPVTVGSVSQPSDGSPRFELWTNFRPRNSPPHASSSATLTGYSIDATVEPDLSISAVASFQAKLHAGTGRILSLDLSRRLHLTSAAVDGKAVEVYQQVDAVSNAFDSDAEFLLVSETPLDARAIHQVEIHYAGAIISQMAQSSYLVAERNLWYPHTDPMFTLFDLRFHCPERFEIVSSGDLVDQQVKNGTRTVHRRTASPEQMAGFNLGEYREQSLDSAPYRIQSYEERSLDGNFNGIPGQAADILRHYTRQWMELPYRTLAITPVPGDFGQGFPGLIYLARKAYLPESKRPSADRAEQSRIFFSDLLLPHEIAHQWWGNMVTADSYRSDWLMEAMANDSALHFMSSVGSRSDTQAVLDQYRADLGQLVAGTTVESSGPLNFGTRLLTTAGFPSWQTVIYKKGTWVLEMLRARMGDENFVKMQVDLLRTFAGKPLSNEDFRNVASRYVPSGQPDRTLELFFDTWVYSTGVPKLSINRAGTKVQVSGVDQAFNADLPLRCKGKDRLERTRWVRIEAGENPVPSAGCKLPSGNDFLYYSR